MSEWEFILGIARELDKIVPLWARWEMGGSVDKEAGWALEDATVMLPSLAVCKRDVWVVLRPDVEDDGRVGLRMFMQPAPPEWDCSAWTQEDREERGTYDGYFAIEFCGEYRAVADAIMAAAVAFAGKQCDKVITDKFFAAWNGGKA